MGIITETFGCIMVARQGGLDVLEQASSLAHSGLAHD
tara:strand:+ start:2150 stop:2260 length:111 start_codon:yes stop_codon:yes gene_type:complete